MKWFLGVVLMMAAAAAGDERHVELEGSKVYMVHPVTKKDFVVLQGLEEKLPELDFWQRPSLCGREARIMVSSKDRDYFLGVLDSVSIKHEVLIEDVKSTLEQEYRVNKLARETREADGRIGFTSYYRYEEINAYLDELAAKYPTKVKVEIAGNSTEGRPIKVVKISSGGSGKPVVLVDAGVHAREWIAPAVALYALTKLVEDITESDVVEKIDWVIVPLVNPDGYEFTHTNTRLWRKTRSKVTSSTCPGVDGNRNYDYKWGMSGGSSSACSDTFAGPTPFSEPETSIIRDLMTEYKGRTKMYLTLHSHGSYLLYAYGFDGSLPPNSAELIGLGNDAANAIKQLAAPGSPNYVVGNSAVALNYRSAGNSQDYATAVADIALNYIIELPSGGSAGFDLPPSRIDQVVKETWGGILVMVRYIIK